MLTSHRKLVLFLCLLFFLTCTIGCGTYKNVKARKDPVQPSFVFGGITRDLAGLGVSSISVFLGAGEAEVDVKPSGFLIGYAHMDMNTLFVFSLIDLPLSFVGDIVTLPVVISSDDRPRPRSDK